MNFLLLTYMALHSRHTKEDQKCDGVRKNKNAGVYDFFGRSDPMLPHRTGLLSCALWGTNFAGGKTTS